MLEFIIISFAVWRLASLFAYEKGPWDIFLKLRSLTRDYRFLNLACFLCVSVLVSLLLALFMKNGGDYLVNALAISTGSIILDKIISND